MLRGSYFIKQWMSRPLDSEMDANVKDLVQRMNDPALPQKEREAAQAELRKLAADQADKRAGRETRIIAGIETR